MRLRADDMHVGGGGEGRCWLCGQEGVGGAHVLRCEWVRKGKERAQAMAQEKRRREEAQMHWRPEEEPPHAPQEGTHEASCSFRLVEPDLRTVVRRR